MAGLKPYDLVSQQEMVRSAIQRHEPLHRSWRALEVLYRTGSIEQAEKASAGTLADLLPEMDRQVVNLVLPHINVMLASIVARDPKHLAEPLSGGRDGEKVAKTAEAVVSYFWKRTQATAELRDATQDALLLGNGFLKTGWAHRERDAEDGDPEWQEAQALAAELAFEGVESDLLDLSSHVVELDEPYVEYASPYDLFVPPNANRMETVRWVCHRVTLPVDEVEANEAFDSSVDVVPDGLEAGDHSDLVAEWKRQAKSEVGLGQNDQALDTATLFEFYDMRTRRLTVFQMGAAAPLFDDDLPYAHRYPPFVHLTNYRQNGNSFWAFGDLENVARVQALFNEMVALQVDNARRSGAKHLVHEDAWTDELEEALLSDMPDVIAKVTAPNGQPLAELIHTVQREGLHGDVYAAKDEFEDHVRKILGINDFQAGGSGADRMSATAAAVVDGIASLRAMDKVASVEAAAARAGEQLLLLCQEFLTEARAVKLTTPQGASWPEVSSADISGEFLMSIEGGSTQAVNPQTREEHGRKTLQEILPLVVEMGMDPMPLLRSGIRDLGYDPDLVLIPRPQPEQPPTGADGAGGEPTGTEQMSDDQIAAAMLGESTAPAAAGVENGGPAAGLAAQIEGGIAL